MHRIEPLCIQFYSCSWVDNKEQFYRTYKYQLFNGCDKLKIILILIFQLLSIKQRVMRTCYSYVRCLCFLHEQHNRNILFTSVMYILFFFTENLHMVYIEIKPTSEDLY